MSSNIFAANVYYAGNVIVSQTLTGAGSGITSLNMGNAGSGTLAVARGGTGVTSSTGTGSVVLSSAPTLSSTVSIQCNSASATPVATFENLNTTTTTAKSFNLQFYGNGAGGQKDVGAITMIPTDGNFGYSAMAFSVRGPFNAGNEAVAEVMRCTRTGNSTAVGIGTTNPASTLSVNGSVILGAAYYAGNFNSKTGPYILQASGFDAVGTTHTIAFSSWQGSVNGDNLGGIMIIIGKNLSASGKVGCMTLSVSKRAGAFTFTQTINNNTVGLSTFSVSISNNDIIITSDSDMAVTWTFIAGV